MNGRTALVLWVVAAVSAAPARDVRESGARGDGLSDDSAALQSAVDARSGTLRFPKGVYRLSRSVVIEMDKAGFTSLVGEGTARIIMAGPGPAFKFVGTHAGSADPEQVKPNVWERQRMPLVDGLEIVGEHPEADGIAAAGTLQLTVTRTTIRNVRHGIHLTVRNRNILISDCHIYKNRGIGIFYDHVNLHQSNITGCHISYCAGGGIVSRGGNVRNIHIGACDIESNMSPEMPPTANILLDSTGGSVGEVAITGCTIQHNSVSSGSANIRILGGGEEAPLVRGGDKIATQEGHIAVTGNVLSDVMVNVHICNARGVVLTGNTFWKGYEHNLLVEDSCAIVAGPNAFDRNPRYDLRRERRDAGTIVFRNSRDCTLTGLHICGARGEPASVLLERCDRMQVADCTILDSDGIGLLLRDVTRSRIAGCLIRDDRPGRPRVSSLILIGGRENWVLHNWLSDGWKVAEGSARVEGNYDGRQK